MFPKVKCLEASDGFSKGSLYAVVGFGETTCILLNDDNKIVGVPHGDINDDELWELQPIDEAREDEEKKKEKAT